MKAIKSAVGVIGLAVFVLTLGLVGCGGGGSSSGNSGGGATSPGTTETGVLSDSAVAGVAYATSPGGKTGTTNANGEYDYVAGDKVTFTVAGLMLPPVTATGRITPQTIADEVFSASGSEAARQAALNLAILFQALDEDGDPSNGITVLEETLLSESVSVESLVESTSQTFANTLQSETLPDDAVVPDPTVALEHFYKTELAGNWRLVGGVGDTDDIFVSIDGAGHMLWVEYEIGADPADCSVFGDGSGYSAIYTGSMDFADAKAFFATNERELMTGCADGSTDHVADMFNGEITLTNGQLVITREDGGSTATFDRFNNVKGSPIGVWQEDGTRSDDGSLDFGSDIGGLFSIYTDNSKWIHIVLDRAASGSSCEYNGVYVADYSFDEEEHVIAIGNEHLNHVWLNPESCDKIVPVNDWEIPASASVFNDSIWEVESEEFALMRNLSTAERTGAFNSTVNAADLIGSWRMLDSSDDDVTLHILNFLNDDKYVQGVIHKDLDDGDFCGHGLEYGSYVQTGAELVFQVQTDTILDQGCGMTEHGDTGEAEIALLSGDKLVLAVDGGWYYLEFNRVKNNNLRGTWVVTESQYPGDGTVLSLLDDGYYLQMQHAEGDEADDSWGGVEYGRYTLSEAGVLKVTELINDENGTSGLSDLYPNGSMTLAIDNDGFLRFDNNDGCFGMQRIEDAAGSVAVQGDCPEEPAEPEPLNMTGTWIVTETMGGNTCDESGSEVVSYSVTQSGTALTVSVGGASYNGSISGNSFSWSGSFPEDGGTTTSNVTGTVSEDGNSMSGSASWSWTDGAELSCSGTTSFTGTRS